MESVPYENSFGESQDVIEMKSKCNCEGSTAENHSYSVA